MSGATPLLYDLEGFAGVSVAEADHGLCRVVIMQTAAEHACPWCGVIAGVRPCDVRESRVSDLPMGHHRLEVTLAEAPLPLPRNCLSAAGVDRRHARNDAPQTIQTWWPEVDAFLRLRVTNAPTEGANRVIKQIKRTGCG